MEGKKSFLLYCDLIHHFEELTDEQSGKLFKIILEYVNDNNPVIDDQLLKIAFIPIKLQLKRDLEEWKATCNRNSDNGKLGGRPKKSEGLNEKPKKPTAFSENPLKAKKADKDNDTDNDKDFIETHNEIFRKLWNSDGWIEPLCMKWKCDKKDFLNHLNGFRIDCISKDEIKESEKDAKSHFVNWVNKGNKVPVSGNPNHTRSQKEEEFERNNWY